MADPRALWRQRDWSPTHAPTRGGTHPTQECLRPGDWKCLERAPVTPTPLSDEPPTAVLMNMMPQFTALETVSWISPFVKLFNDNRDSFSLSTESRLSGVARKNQGIWTFCGQNYWQPSCNVHSFPAKMTSLSVDRQYSEQCYVIF